MTQAAAWQRRPAGPPASFWGPPCWPAGTAHVGWLGSPRASPGLAETADLLGVPCPWGPLLPLPLLFQGHSPDLSTPRAAQLLAGVAGSSARLPRLPPSSPCQGGPGHLGVALLRGLPGSWGSRLGPAPLVPLGTPCRSSNTEPRKGQAGRPEVLRVGVAPTCMKYSSNKQSTQGSATSIGRTSLEMSQHLIRIIFSWRRDLGSGVQHGAGLAAAVWVWTRRPQEKALWASALCSRARVSPGNPRSLPGAPALSA